MNRDTPIKLYCKKVGQHLDCGRKEKTELLRGLCEEITEAAQQAADYSELVRKYGAPEETAATLQAALKEETVRQYQKKRSRKSRLFLGIGILVIVLLSAALVFLVDYMREDTPAKLVEVIYDESPDSSTLDDLDWINEE